RSAREESINRIESQRSAKPAGPHMAVLYVDLRRAEGQAAPAPQPSLLPAPEEPAPTASTVAPPKPGSNIPLPPAKVVLEPSPSGVRVALDGVGLESAGAAPPAPGQGPATIKINVAPLLQAALMHP